VRRWEVAGPSGRLAQAVARVEASAKQWSEEDAERRALELYDPATRLLFKELLIAGLSIQAGPRAVLALRSYLAEPDPGLEDLALAALEAALRQTPEGAGYDRNSPCPCGSGAKWKHCCAREDGAWSTVRRRGGRAAVSEGGR
jgi:uncharacterized protein YecA (UPF0149 family)